MKVAHLWNFTVHFSFDTELPPLLDLPIQTRFYSTINALEFASIVNGGRSDVTKRVNGTTSTDLAEWTVRLLNQVDRNNLNPYNP